jgi:ABC-2 type transport system ATP-binding protein
VIVLIYLAIGLVSVLMYGVGLLLVSKRHIELKKILQVLSVILFVVYLFRLFSSDVIDGTFNLLGTDQVTPIDAAATWLFPVGRSLVIFFLRWVTLPLVGLAIVGSYFSEKVIRNLLGFVGLPIAILNVIFFNAHIIAFLGSTDVAIISYRGIQFAAETTLLLVICGLNLTQVLRKKDHVAIGKQLGAVVSLLLCLMMAFFPQALLGNLFGNYGESPYDFVVSHRITIYIAFLFMILSYAIMRSKTQEDKNLFFVILALAGLFQYFYIRRPGIGGLPLHLCNTAIIMMFFSFVFKWRGVFYFSYFVNVLGALCAILLPNFTSDLFNLHTVAFWYNHIYAFTLPVLGVALGVFPRPTLKMMYKAIAIFTLYFLLVVFLNAWFNNYTSTDYFFVYSDFLSSKFGAERIQYANVLAIQFQGLTFRFFYVSQLITYVGFIILMFVTWAVYDALFKVSDHHYALLLRKRMYKMDMLKLRESLGGRSMTERVAPPSDEMIKITHFSKRYGSSNAKAVRDFSLTIHAGEVFGFLGHNGAGKSTTIKSLVGIQSITEGEMEICGYNIQTQPLQAKLNIGYVSDNHAVYEKLTGREYINYVADLYLVNQQDRDERLTYYMTRFALADAIDNEIKSYSHGMKQKLVVISSLIHDPKVWILDEPLTGLDPTSSYQIKECMREHANKGNTVFFSSHVIEVVEKICDRIAIISHGKLEGVWSIKELKASGISLESLYLKYVDQQTDSR